MITLFAVITGYILDLIFGDPKWLPHPIRFIGWLISSGERLLRIASCKTDRSQYFCGMILTVSVVGLAFFIPYGLIYVTRNIHPFLGFVLEAFMCYQIFAVKSLKDESMKVYDQLHKADLNGARQALSRIVSRDTENLSAEQVTKGAVETVAENLSDGVIAPMIYLLMGGVPLGFFYKAINTLDSMVGYKNEQYFHFGRFAAKLDDAANYLPARISGYLMIIAVWLLRYDIKDAIRIYRRDRKNHASPNSAHTEAVCAGAFRIRLGGTNSYFGRIVNKPTIGDEIRQIETEDIRRVNQLLYLTSCLALIIGAGLKLLVIKAGTS